MENAYHGGNVSKYKNKKTTIDGITFDSKKEGARYQELKLMEKAGAITCLALQPRYDLLPTVKWNGQTLRKRSYVADFRYIENGKIVVEDVKGFRTPMYKLKRHIFVFMYHDIDFREI